MQGTANAPMASPTTPIPMPSTAAPTTVFPPHDPYGGEAPTTVLAGNPADPSDPDATVLSARTAETATLPTAHDALSVNGLRNRPLVSPTPGVENKPLERLVARTEEREEINAAEADNPPMPGDGANAHAGDAPTTAMAPTTAAPMPDGVPLPETPASSAPTMAIPMPGNGNGNVDGTARLQPTEVLQPTAPTQAMPAESPVPMPRTMESENEAPALPDDGDTAGDGAPGGNGTVPPGGISPAGANGPETPDGPGANAGNHKRVIIIAVMCVIALVVAAGIVMFGMNRRHDTALAACNDAQTALTNAEQSLKKSKEAAVKATATKSSDVSDPSAIDDLKDLSNTNVGGSVDNTKSANACSADLKANILQQHADTLNRAATKRTDLATKLDDGTQAVYDGQAAKTVTTSRSTLQSTTDSAQQLMTSSNGKVADDSTRTALKKAIDEATKLLEKYKDDSSWKTSSGGSSDSSSSSGAAAGSSGAATAAKEMNDANTTVKNAMDAVNRSVSARQAADAKKKAEEEAKKRAEEQKKAEAAADKTRCASIAGTYGMWQGSPKLTISADCSATQSDVTGSGGWSGTYVPNSYQSGTWKLSTGRSLTYYPAGTTAPSIKQYMQSAGGGSGPNKAQIQTSDGTPYVRE
ncbi:hypothetical protein [Bifidobacterium pluvialisilvae]|uniref:hypothetical protein n=1 Tax=Bifidobacterium pluvialisilvae TaxID=2834436 RepID=UPI001F3A3AEA|nr:hypothetical protein [Bifidobacterium pluvialisilvae]